MRLRILLPLVATALLASSVAAAQGVPFGANGNGNQNGSGSSSSSDDDDEDADKPIPYAQRKAWSIGASFETNRTIQQEEVGGRIKAFNTLQLFSAYNITKKDRVSLSGGFMQRFVADETETGIRADDIGMRYSHRFQLPWQLILSPTVGNSIPISFRSRLMGLIALPRASLMVGRSFLDNNLFVGINGGGSYYIVEYKEAVGQSDVNDRASANVGLSVNYSMPFHQPLQVGASVSTAYSWQYEPDHANDPMLAEQFKNTPVQPSGDPYYTRSARQQSYAGEVYISYNLPSLVGMQSNFQVSLSQGDGVLRDGATHLYWLSRRGGQVSASLTVSY